MSKQRLRAVMPGAAEFVVGHTGIPLGPFSSNLFAFCRSARA
jgi:hypothetical protein